MKIISGQDESNQQTKHTIFYTLRGTLQSKTHFVLNLEKSFNGKISATHNNHICVPHNLHQKNHL